MLPHLVLALILPFLMHPTRCTGTHMGRVGLSYKRPLRFSPHLAVSDWYVLPLALSWWNIMAIAAHRLPLLLPDCVRLC